MLHKKSLLLGSAVAVAASFMLSSGNVNAVEITGAISFAGGYTPDDGNLTSATTVTFDQSVFVVGANGDFSGSAGAVTMANSLTWDPLFSVDSNPLWSVNGFSFSLTSLAITDEQSNSITLNGSGTVSKTGFEDTATSWVATFNTASGTYSWSSSSASVPDGGMSITLLGVALVGAGALRRKW